MAKPDIAPPRSWGHSTVTTACPLDCPDSCSLAVTVERGRVIGIDASADAPATGGYICGKVRRFDRRVYGDTRLPYPAIRRGPKGGGSFERVPWDEALDLVASRMRDAADRHGPESVLPYFYGGSNGLLTNNLEDARFFRRFGASELARTICAAPTGAAAAAMYGRMAGVAYADYEEARLIVVWGANPSASSIHLVPHVKRARARGARLVVIDPRLTPLARAADLHLPVRPGTDLPVALAVIHRLFETGRADLAFLAEHATGTEALAQAAAEWSVERAADVAGLDPTALKRFADWYGEITPAVIRCGWGQERNRNGGHATMAILALPAVAGKFGVRGGGYTMSNSAAWGLDAEHLIGEPAGRRRVVNMNRLGRALTEGMDPPIAVLFVYNSNPVATAPDQNRVRRGLARDDLFTVVHDQVMTDTATYADVLLPATTFLEHYDIARGYGAYHLHIVRPAVAPAHEARPNHEVFQALGQRLGLGAGDPDGLGETGALVDVTTRLPSGLGDALAAGRPAPPPAGGRPIQFVDVHPGTPDGRIALAPTLASPDGLYRYQPDPATEAHPLSLITPASRRTISSTLGELRPGVARLKIHPEDAGPRSIGNGDSIRVFNALGEVECEADVTPEVRPGCVSLPKGLWLKSTFNGSTANALVPDSLTDLGDGACFNDARVEVELKGRH